MWAAPSEPLPIESADSIRAIASPAWLVSGTRADGIVRVINHGTDHAVEGTPSSDSPLYARLGYSTATIPPLDEASWRNPFDQTVALVHADGRSTHRSGMRASVPYLDDDGVGVAGSTWVAHWLDATPTAQRHGGGLPGTLAPAGDLEVRSLVRAAWEVRLVRVNGLAAGAAATGIRVGGWPIAGDDPEAHLAEGGATVGNGRLTSGIRMLRGAGTARVERVSDSSPLGATTGIPLIELPVTVGSWIAVLVTLSGEPVDDSRASIELAADADTLTVAVTWPDGLRTTHHLTDPQPVATTPVATTVGHQDRAQG